MTIEPFMVRAVLAAIALAVLAAPLGALVIWRRMSYFGATIAHSGLLGVVLGLMMSLDLTLSVLLVAAAIAVVLIAFERQNLLPTDSLLGLLSHAALAGGVLAAAKFTGRRLDLMGYLFGDIFAISNRDLVWIYGGGFFVLAAIGLMWRAFVSMSVHEELAAAEGLHVAGLKAAFVLILAFVVAIAMKIVGILLIVAFLVMPAAAARPFAVTPEAMVGGAALIGVAGSILGLYGSWVFDLPGGASIVLVLAVFSFISLARVLLVRRQ